MKHKEHAPISQRDGWMRAGLASAFLGTVAVGACVHQTLEASPTETATAASTAGLMILALCTGLYRHDRHRNLRNTPQPAGGAHDDRTTIEVSTTSQISTTEAAGASSNQ